jgi:hypothetical protein
VSGGSPYHLVGAQQYSLGYRQPERLGGFQVHYEPNIGGLLNPQTMWLKFSPSRMPQTY